MVGRGIGLGSAWGLPGRQPLRRGLLLPYFSDTTRANIAATVWDEWFFYGGLRGTAAAQATSGADLSALVEQSLEGTAGGTVVAAGDLGGSLSVRFVARGRAVNPGWAFRFRRSWSAGEPALFSALEAADRTAESVWTDWYLYDGARADAVVKITAGADLRVEQDQPLSADALAAAIATGDLVILPRYLVGAAIATASATGSLPTPGPGFGCWTRTSVPFARYIGRAVSFAYRQYYEGDFTQLAGDAQAVATAAADLGLTVIGLAGDAVVRVAVTGDLIAGIIVAEELSGDARVSSTVTGALDTDQISGAAAGLVTAAGQVGMAAPLSAEAVARAIAAGTPSVLVPLGASAQVISAVTGALLGTTGLTGDAESVASATGIANLLQSLSGSAASRAAAVAALTIGASMTGSAAAVGTVAGALGVGMDLDADAQARASASGATGVSVDLSGQATAAAEAAGTLRDVGTITGGTTYAVNLSTNAVTTLLNFDFERLTRAHSALYGLKSGTLYQVAGDVDPSSAPIPATLRLAPWMPSSGVHQYRLNYFYLRARETDGLTVTPIYDEVFGIPYQTAADARLGARTTKVGVGLGNAWHSLGLIVQNRNGGQIGLAGVEMVVSPLSRRPK